MMQKSILIVLTMLVVLCLMLGTASAQTAGIVPVQGKLTDAEGTAVDGDVSVALTLYADDGTGTMMEVWSNDRTITVDDGVFAIYLGAQQELNLEIFRDYTTVYLGLAFDGDSEMPLIEIGAAPYAGYAAFAGSAGDATSVQGMDPADLGPLGMLSCGNGQIPVYDGTTWGCGEDQDTTLSEAEVDAFADNNGYLGASDVSAVATSGDFGDLANVPTGLSDGDDDTLGGLICSNGQVVKRINNAWACGVDETATYTGSYPVQVSGNTISLASGGISGPLIAPNTITDGNIASTAGINPTKISGTAATLSGDQNFDSNTLVIDAAANRVGVGVPTPGSALDVAGDISLSGDVQYSSPRTSYIQIPPSAFSITSASEDEEVTQSSFSGYLYISGGTATYGVTMGAPINLPQGVTITELTCYAYDSAATDDLNSDVDLRRRAVTATGGSTMATADLDATTGLDSNTVYSGSDTTILNPVVDNSQYNYFLDLYFYTTDTTGSTMRFYGCTLAYEASVVLP